jgi:hypothetical protein
VRPDDFGLRVVREELQRGLVAMSVQIEVMLDSEIDDRLYQRARGV